MEAVLAHMLAPTPSYESKTKQKQVVCYHGEVFRELLLGFKNQDFIEMWKKKSTHRQWTCVVGVWLKTLQMLFCSSFGITLGKEC